MAFVIYSVVVEKPNTVSGRSHATGITLQLLNLCYYARIGLNGNRDVFGGKHGSNLNTHCYSYIFHPTKAQLYVHMAPSY